MLSNEFYEDLKRKRLRYCPSCKKIKGEKMFRLGCCIECSNAIDRQQYTLTIEKRAEKYKKQRNESDYFVYKFLDVDKRIIYIGKTIRLPARMVQHFKTDSHLTEECYDKVEYVFYSSLKTKAEMDIYEIYLIDKFRPHYNIKSVYEQEEVSGIVLPDLIWQEYQNESLDFKEKSKMPSPKKAVMSVGIEDIRGMVNTLGDSLVDRRDRSLLLIGFATACRRSELVAIMVEDIEFNRDGLTITLYNSKTTPDGQENKKSIPYGNFDDTCPVRSLQEWLKAANITSGPLFRGINRHGKVNEKALSDQSVNLIIKKLAKATGLDEKKYSGDSLHFGSIMMATNRGVDIGL